MGAAGLVRTQPCLLFAFPDVQMKSLVLRGLSLTSMTNRPATGGGHWCGADGKADGSIPAPLQAAATSCAAAASAVPLEDPGRKVSVSKNPAASPEGGPGRETVSALSISPPAKKPTQNPIGEPGLMRCNYRHW